MKRLVSIFVSCVLLFSLCIPIVSAHEVSTSSSSTIEYLENGDYVITAITQTLPELRSSSTSGTKTATYYNSNDSAIFAVEVYGTFNYSYASSSYATSSTATVYIYNSTANFINKSAYTSGATAYAYGEVSYYFSTVSRTVSLTCDPYGNLY